jgi:hypothetical protein
MNHWHPDGSFDLHVFHKNNELDGYSSVLHAMQLAGSTGDYGPRLRAVVIGFGATARGAVTALHALGVHDVDVLTQRQAAAVSAPGTVVVDVSCDAGMGFGWARPTTFDQPTFMVGDGVLYYAVDHSPSLLWKSATWEVSAALLPFLRTVMDGSSAWDEVATVRRAIEIRDGVTRGSSSSG